jgi:hypothetical protein
MAGRSAQDGQADRRFSNPLKNWTNLVKSQPGEPADVRIPD